MKKLLTFALALLMVAGLFQQWRRNCHTDTKR